MSLPELPSELYELVTSLSSTTMNTVSSRRDKHYLPDLLSTDVHHPMIGVYNVYIDDQINGDWLTTTNSLSFPIYYNTAESLGGLDTTDYIDSIKDYMTIFEDFE